jgi:hypothetical protein
MLRDRGLIEIKSRKRGGASMGRSIEESTVRRKRKRQSAKGPRGALVPRAPVAGGEDLNAAARALLGREEKPRGMRPEPRDDASVEDPLLDWQED